MKTLDNYLNKIVCGDCVEIMKQFPDDCIDLTVTSPPYSSLRSYNGYSFDFPKVVDELYRVTKLGGVVAWVVGDATIKGSEDLASFKQALYFKDVAGFLVHDTMIYEKNGTSFPAKRDGNRYSQIWEFMFVFSKGKPKTHNLICDKKNRWEGYTSFGKCKFRKVNGELVERKMKPVPEFSPRNNIWRYNTGRNYTTKDEIAYKHPAVFPELLAKDHITTWSLPEDIVLDCMAGSGTVGVMAYELNRKFILCDISSEYCNIMQERFSKKFGADIQVLDERKSIF